MFYPSEQLNCSSWSKYFTLTPAPQLTESFVNGFNLLNCKFILAAEPMLVIKVVFMIEKYALGAIFPIPEFSITSGSPGFLIVRFGSSWHVKMNDET